MEKGNADQPRFGDHTKEEKFRSQERGVSPNITGPGETSTKPVRGKRQPDSSPMADQKTVRSTNAEGQIGNYKRQTKKDRRQRIYGQTLKKW